MKTSSEFIQQSYHMRKLYETFEVADCSPTFAESWSFSPANAERNQGSWRAAKTARHAELKIASRSQIPVTRVLFALPIGIASEIRKPKALS